MLKSLFFCLLFLCLVVLAVAPWCNSWVFSPLEQQAGSIHAKEISAQTKEVVLLTEEIRTLESRMELQESAEHSFLISSTHLRIPEQPSENVKSAPKEDKAEVQRQERLRGTSPVTSNILVSAFEQTLVLEKTLVHSYFTAQELQQQNACSNHAVKRGDLNTPQEEDHHHMSHLLSNQKSLADLTSVMCEDVIKVDHEDSTQLKRRPESTEAPALPPVNVKASAVVLVGTGDLPPDEAKLLPDCTEDRGAQRNKLFQYPQEEKTALSLVALQKKKTTPPEQKLESYKEVCSSTTAAVAVPSSEGQRKASSMMDIFGQSLCEDPQSGLSCSGSLHQTSSHLYTSCLLSCKSSCTLLVSTSYVLLCVICLPSPLFVSLL